jgi:hypothetical protein
LPGMRQAEAHVIALAHDNADRQSTQ